MRTCPFCGTENEPFFRFCLGCGEDLDKVFAPAPPAVPTRAAAPEPPPELTPAGADVTARLGQAAGVGSPAPTGAGRRPSSVAVQTVSDDFGAAKTELDLAPVQVPSESRSPADRPATAGPGALKRESGAQSSRRSRRRQISATLVQVYDNGTEEPIAELSSTPLVIGRLETPIEASEAPWDPAADVLGFPDDDFLAPRQVQLYVDFDGVVVEPVKSTNGVFMQITTPFRAGVRTTFRVGQQLLQVDRVDSLAKARDASGGPDSGHLGSPVPENAWGRLAQVITPTQFGDVHLLGGEQVRLGRERGDINFPTDLFVSGLHAVVRWIDGQIEIEDLQSSNGTYVRIDEPTTLASTTALLVGQQLFRIDVHEE